MQLPNQTRAPWFLEERKFRLVWCIKIRQTDQKASGADELSRWQRVLASILGIVVE